MSGAAEFQPQNPLIVQGDHTVLVEVDNPLYAEARDALARFAELVKSPEHIHTYRVTPLSIWNACAVGETARDHRRTLRRLSKYALPGHVGASVRDFAARYGCLKLTRRDGDSLLLRARDLPLAEELAHQKTSGASAGRQTGRIGVRGACGGAGAAKTRPDQAGFPHRRPRGVPGRRGIPADSAPGERFGQAIRPARLPARGGARLFHAGGAERGGSGVIVLPCGAGKTIVGMACMALVRASTLILATSVTAARQWKTELLDKTTLAEEDRSANTAATTRRSAR